MLDINDIVDLRQILAILTPSLSTRMLQRTAVLLLVKGYER
jgi:hypothetical protein